jgi:hypothetical protein
MTRAAATIGSAAAPLDLDGKLVHGGEQGAAVQADLADGELVPEVQAEGRGDALEDAVRGARFRAAASFLRGLEQKSEPAGGRPAAKPLGHREADRHVAVVAAGVHLAGNPGSVRRARRLLERQGIHVRAQEDSRRAGARGRVRRDAGPADPGARRQTEPGQPPGHDSRGARLLEPELGVLMKVAPGRDERLEFPLREALQQLLKHPRIIRAGLVAAGIQSRQLRADS